MIRSLVSVLSILSFVVAFAPGISAAPATCFGKTVTISGTVGPDVITGTPLSDVIFGRAGRDQINGKGGDDFICGGYDADGIAGGDGNDTITGDAGRDTLGGGHGNDSINTDSGLGHVSGGPGNDVLRGQYVDGGLGDDQISANTVVYRNSSSGINYSSLTGIATGQGRDKVNALYFVGSEFADSVTVELSGCESITWCEPAMTMLGGADTVHAANPSRDETTTLYVLGGLGNDSLFGAPSPCADEPGFEFGVVECQGVRFNGDEGNDRIEPGGGNRGFGGEGADLLIGSAYPDYLNSVDQVGGNDTVDGNGGTDWCPNDPGDVVTECEQE